MSKRLQVVMDESEWAEIEAAATQRGLTVSEWVRGVLRVARREQATGSVDRRLSAIRVAARHDFPTGDIETMNAEIEAGHRTELPE